MPQSKKELNAILKRISDEQDKRLYPEEDENFLGNIIIRREGDTCAADFQPVPPRDRIAAPPPGDAVTDLDLM